MNFSRRGFLGGLAGLIAAPAIIRTPGLLMPVKKIIQPAGLILDGARGDRVLNANLGGPIGWVCVVAGSPGTWMPFGDELPLRCYGALIGAAPGPAPVDGPAAICA